MSSSLRIVVPVATTNLVLNPSVLNNLTGYNDSGGSVIVRDDAEQRHGIYSIRWTPGADPDAGVYYSLALTAGQVYTFSVSGLFVSGVNYLISFADNAGLLEGTPFEFKGNGRWERHSVTYIPVASAVHRVYVTKDGEISLANVWLDGWQVEALAFVTTYCDGDQGGCSWDGTTHASTSSRTAQTRAGGRERDPLDDFNVNPALPWSGFGVPPIGHNSLALAQQPGALLQSVEENVRQLVVRCQANPITDPEQEFSEDVSDMVKALDALWDAIKPDLVPDEVEPFLLRWLGPSGTVEIGANYFRGMEGLWDNPTCDEFDLTLRCYKVFWEELGNTADPLDSEDQIAMRAVIGFENGRWGNLGPMPNDAGAANNRGLATAVDEDRRILYVVGGFTVVDADATWNRLAAFDLTTRVWSNIGDADNIVAGVVVSNDGRLFVTGVMANISGVAVGRFAVYDPTTGVWSDGGSVAEVFVATGGLHVAGNRIYFTAIVGALGTLWYYNTVTDALVDTGIGAGFMLANAMGTLPGGNILVGDIHDTFPAQGLMVYDPIADARVANGGPPNIGTQPNAILVTSSGIIYIGGDNIDGAGSVLMQWDGSPGVDAVVVSDEPNGLVGFFAMGEAPDGTIYIGGEFVDTVAGVLLPNAIGVFDGKNWRDISAALPTAAVQQSVLGMTASKLGIFACVADDVDMLEGTMKTAGITPTVENEGSAKAYPEFVFTRNGGTDATLRSIVNVTTGQFLIFNTPIIDGDTVRVILEQQNKRIVSDLTGDITNTLQPVSSDFARFALLPGENDINVFIETNGNPAIRAHVVWRNTHWQVGGMER